MIIGVKVNQILVDDAIIDLYAKMKMFPKQHNSICKKIKEISIYASDNNAEVQEVLKNVEEEFRHLEEQKNERISNVGNLKVVSVNNNLPLPRDKTEEEKREEAALKEEEIKVKELYFQRVTKIIDKMNKEIGENAQDNEKLKWIYKYVWDIPFDHSYGLYKDKEYGTLRPDLARINAVNSYNRCKFGIFDKENLLLAKEKTGVCIAMAGLFEDLCAFAGLKKAYCGTVNGKHEGVKHTWNYVVNENGVFYLDASEAWHKPPVDSFKIQFMATPYDLAHVLFSYRDYKEVEYEYVPPKIKVVSVNGNPTQPVIKSIRINGELVNGNTIQRTKLNRDQNHYEIKPVRINGEPVEENVHKL